MRWTDDEGRYEIEATTPDDAWEQAARLLRVTGPRCITLHDPNGRTVQASLYDGEDIVIDSSGIAP